MILNGSFLFPPLSKRWKILAGKFSLETIPEGSALQAIFGHNFNRDLDAAKQV